MKNKHINPSPIAQPPNEHQAKEILRSYGIPVVTEQVAADAQKATQAARQLGYPVVVKGLGARLLHKTEKGLVHLHVHDDQALRLATESIVSAAGDDLEGFLVQSQVSGHRELMVGMFHDAQFGPVLLFGIGGVLAEALDDVVLHLAPLDEVQAGQMIDRIRSRKLLDAFRNEAAVHRPTLINILTGLSRLALEHPEVSEIDINPVMIKPDGHLVAVDALIQVVDSTSTADCPPVVPPKRIFQLFHPRSIAFVGASSHMGKWGHVLPVNTISGGYQGRIYLVNPKGGTIFGRNVYTRIGDIPDPVDLAVVTIPAAGVMELIPQLQARNIEHMLLITSGFGETGSEGKELERQLTEAARRAGITVLGPNTMGIANPHIDFYCTGSTVKPRAGGTAMVAQSGNLGTQLLAFAEEQGIGIRGFCGSGNEAMITIEDYLEGFEVDDKTRTVLLYLESVKNGRRFYEAARRVSRKKPIVLLMGGQSSAGKKAAASHTGALMSDSRVFDAMCRQSGVIKVEQPMELLDLAAALSSLPLPRGPRVAIMTWGGGWGVVTCDLCQSRGLEVPELDPQTIQRIDQILPPYWSRANPVDLVGEADLSIPMSILEELIRWGGCDAVINLGIMGRRLFVERFTGSVSAADQQISPEFLQMARRIISDFEQDFINHSVKLMRDFGKPIIGVSLLTNPEDQTVRRVPGAQHNGIFYETPERAVNALAKIVQYAGYLASDTE